MRVRSEDNVNAPLAPGVDSSFEALDIEPSRDENGAGECARRRQRGEDEGIDERRMWIAFDLHKASRKGRADAVRPSKF